ncbi:MAG: Flp pilus assembly complex ATPase component TadA [Armatimonadetes bacterium]|nr:Flp pilus assembly complex ATPase component TadA [Armatimonadota bacterium]
MDLSMDLSMMMPILAAVPDGTGYVNLLKIGTVVVLLFLWGLSAQWVDRDTNVVKTRREHWNMIVISGALVGFFALFVIPWKGVLFFLGIGFWFVLTGGALLMYIFHRNGRVVPAARVCTIDHVKRLLRGGRKDKRSKSDKGVRVQLENHEGKFVERPKDPDELAGYEAVQDLLFDVLRRRASDVDMLAGKEQYRIVLHIDGVASEQSEGMPAEQGERVFRFLKRIAGLNVEEVRRPQRGRIQAALLSQTGHIGPTDVITSGTTAGERMRLHVQAGPTLLRLEDLGLASSRLKGLQAVLEEPTGLLIFSATAGQGVSTTQYAVLRSHDAYMHNIHALERRATIDLDNITQQVYEGTNTDVNYARVLQSLLRREPDIVLVADCEDRETAQLAARAAAEDRKIYLGLQAKDAFEALERYQGFVEDNALVGRGLLGVINQRLVRKLCMECREAYRPDPATLKKLNLPVDKIECFYRPPSEPKFNKKGKEIQCSNCQGSGYVGRFGVFELLIVDDAVRNLIVQGAPIKTIKAQCRKKRMYYLQEEALLKVIDGSTSMNEVLRILRNSDKQGG